jgi:hypothetical protein
MGLSFLSRNLIGVIGASLLEARRRAYQTNCKILKTDEFYRKKLWLLCIDAPRWPKVSRITYDQSLKSGGSSGIWPKTFGTL